jgi:hypothetical protein
MLESQRTQFGVGTPERQVDCLVIHPLFSVTHELTNVAFNKIGVSRQ